MNKQKVYLNSCEITIDNITLYKQMEEQQVYFMWKKGKKFAKSNPYDIEYNQPTLIGEKMQLSLKIYTRNGKPQTKNTHFYILVCQQGLQNTRQLSDFILGIHEWTNNRQKIKLEIKEAGKIFGVVNLQVKRRQVMQLQNFHKYSAEIQQSSEAQNTIVVMDVDGNRVQGELILLQKELEDVKCLNEKLKKDRAFLVTRNQTVQKQIISIKSNVQEEVNRMKAYYEKKLQIRTSIYQQQIQELITTFNETSKTNTVIMKSIIHENESLAADITELRMISEEELEKQNIHYKNKLMEANEERERLLDTIQQQQIKIEHLDRDLVDVTARLDSTKIELDDLTLSYGIHKNDSKSKCDAYEKQLDSQRKLISDLKNQLNQKTQLLKASKQQQINLHDEIYSLNEMMEKIKLDRLKTEAELLDKKQLLEMLKIEKEENTQTIKSLQSEYEKYIEQSEKKGISYQKQLQEIELQSKQKEMEFDKIINDERQKYYNQNIKLTEVTMKLEDFQKIMIVKDQEVKAYLDENAKLNEQYLEEHRKAFEYEQQIKELLQQQEHYKMLHESAQSKVALLTQQLNSCYKKNQEDLETLRDHFEASMKNREKYYEEEIVTLRAKTEHSEGTYLKLTNDFRVQIQLYKQQIQKEQQQMLKQIKQNSELIAKNKNLEIECMQFQQLLAEAKTQLQERQRKHQQELNAHMRNSLARGQDHNYGEPILGKMKDSKNNFLSPSQSLSIQVPKLNRIDSMPDPQQLQYLQYLKNFGSVEHLKYLLGVEETNKENENQIDRLQEEKRQLQKNNKSLISELQKNHKELTKIREENLQLTELIEQLKQELRFYMDQQQERQQEEVQQKKQSLGTKNDIAFNGNMSFRSEQQKMSEAKSAQDLKDRKSLSRSRISRALSLVNTKQQEAQVEIITFDMIQNYEKEIEQQKLKNALLQQQVQELKNNKVQRDSQKSKNIRDSKSKGEIPIQYPARQNKQLMALQRQNSGLLKKIADYENQNVSRDEEIKVKQIRIEKLEQRNRQLLDEFSVFKQQIGAKMEMQESKLLQYSEMTKKQDEEVSKMKSTLVQKEQQIRETQHNLNLKLTKADYENEQLKTENSKLKKEMEEAVEKSKKNVSYNDFHKIMQQDIEDANRKIIQLNRTVNQLRMEKQSAEDEVRIYKKKFTDSERNLSDIAEKRAIAEEQSQVAVRKFNKLKRQFDDKQQQLLRYQENLKKMQEELSSYNALSSQTLLQRKRGLQEKLQLEEQVNIKNAQIRKLTKQLQRHMQKISESDEYTKQRKNNSVKQIEKLEMELLKQRKLTIQLEEQVSTFTQKIQNTEQQNKKRAEEQKQQYRQKLSSLANDIVQVKNQLEINNAERQALLQQKIALRDELDDCMEYINRLEQLKERLEKERGEWLEQFGKMERQLMEVKRELIHYQQDSIDLHTKIVSLEEQLNKQRLISVRKSEKVQQYEHLSQKYLYELKNNKVALAELQATVQTDNNLRSTITQLQNQLVTIKQKFDQLNQQYHKYKLHNIYSREQVEELVIELKENYEEVRRKQLADTIDSLDHEYEQKNIKREKEIIELYNQNAKAKMEAQRKEDENAQLLQKYMQIEPYQAKYKKLRQQYDELTEQQSYLRQQVQGCEHKYQKYELNIKQLQRVIADLKHQVTRCKSELANQKTKTSRLEQDLLESQTVYSITKEQLKKIMAKGNEIDESQKTLIQNQEQKILSIELENMRVKEREQNLHRQYKQQINKLELKIKQAMSTMQQENMILERDSRGKLEQKQRQIKQANRKLSSATANYQQIVNQLNTLKGENNELANELANTRLQMSEDEEIYICEINKLKNNIKEMEEIYQENVNQLEEELAELNRQLTVEKLAHRQQNSLGSSRLRDSEVERRLQQKMRTKDNKIEQLKSQIFMLQETVANLKKRQQADGQVNENGTSFKYRNLYQELTVEIQNINKKHELQTTNYEQTQKQLRKELIKAKQVQQGLKLQHDQQNLQLQSLRCQLNLIKEVYETLQKQLQKRQIKLVQNMNAQTSHDRELGEKNLHAKQLENMLNETRAENEKLKARIKDMGNQLAVLDQSLRQQKAMVNKLNRSDNKKVPDLKQQPNQELKEEIQRLYRENKRLCTEIDILKSEIARARSREIELERLEKKTSKQYAQVMQKLYASQDIVGKYSVVNEKSLQNHGVSVQQLVLGGYLDEKFFDQEQELNRIRQEVQEMKFTEDQKNLDIEQMRRQNLELHLKMEEYDYINEQVDTLRKICDKLEEQKKIAVFRQEAIRVRLSNLIHRNEARENIRDGLQAILNYNYNVYT